jgi:predicted XRE-type DNA-binding protein
MMSAVDFYPTIRITGSRWGTRIMRRDMVKKRSEGVVTASSGSIFRDLGIKNADEEQAKVRLAVAINRILENLTQQEAAKQLGTKQPNVSALRNYRLGGFSAERLMHFLNALDHDVEIQIRRKPRSQRKACIKVTAGELAVLRTMRA